MSIPDILKNKINNIRAEIKRLDSTLESVTMATPAEDSERYMKLSLDAAQRGEVIACRLRDLVFLGASPEKRDNYLAAAAQLQGIDIRYRDGILEVSLPCLLPKKRRSNCEFVLDPLHTALLRYRDAHRFDPFRQCVVCCVHVYDRALPARRVRDYDNLEQKKFLDCLAMYAMADDTGRLCESFNMTEFGDADRTIFYLMECSRFPEWYIERKEKLTEIGDV